MTKAKDIKSLSVRDPEAHRLALAIAEITGETISRAVTQALQEKYERLRGQLARASVEELLRIADGAAVLVKRPGLDHAALLYDERGLPK